MTHIEWHRPPTEEWASTVHSVAMGRRVTMRVCAEPGCPTLTKGRRCTTHQAQAEVARGTRQQRGYDADHDALRKQWQQRMDAGETVRCWRCTRLIDRTNWHLGHDDVDRTKYRGPECPTCNTQAGGRAAHRA